MKGKKVKEKEEKKKKGETKGMGEFDIMYGEGISKTGEIVDIGVDLDIIKKSGAWYAYGDAKIAQGREAAKTFMVDNPEVAAEIEARIKAKLMGTDEESIEVDQAKDAVEA